MPSKSRLASVLAAMAALSACQSTNLPPHLAPTATLALDEERLWNRSSEEQSVLDRSDFHTQLPEIEAYLNSVLAKLHPELLAGKAPFRARVLADPTLNAFAFPNGAIYVHTGMLARIDNEAQLATILSHELCHATHRHALRGMRSLKNKTAFFGTLAAGTSGLGLGGSVVTLLGGLGTTAAISGYSQDLEHEADVRGFDRMLAAGYDPREAPKVFRTLLEESNRSKITEPYFFGSHPRLRDRIGHFERLLARLPTEKRQGRLDAEVYAQTMLPVFELNAQAALRAGDYEGARVSAHRLLAFRADDPDAQFLIAETYRKEAGEEGSSKAKAICRSLVEKNPDFPDAHRLLALLLMQAGDTSSATIHFRRYLDLKPDARDRAYVENFLNKCENTPSS